ncbi:MAG TPA: hypothetical protein VNY31_02510 [Solirubrobacteraceae bacterium]|jgi:hypothetical protein|nr:hypothetical protein [Solirubrobacteraceae bacterium]
MLGRLIPRLAVYLFAPAALAIAGCSSASSSGSSGNGVSSKSPTEILAASKAAADSASSVHVAGTLINNGTRITLNLSLASGHGGRGQISQNNLSFKLIVIGNTIYIKGSPAFYSHFGGTAAAQLFQGKWLKAPVSGGELGSLAALTNFGQLIDQSLTSQGTLTKGATTTVAGASAVELRDTSHNGSLFVASTGKPYPVEIVKHGSETGHITFTNWHQPVSLSVPSGAIDLSQLQHAGH